MRIASDFPAYCYNEVTAEYRSYESSVSRNSVMMWKSALKVLRRQWPLVKGDTRYAEAYNLGIHRIHGFYIQEIYPSEEAETEWRSYLYELRCWRGITH